MQGSKQSIVLFLIFLLLPMGCSTVDKVKDAQMAKDLKRYLHGYESALRWGQPGQAYAFLKPEIGIGTGHEIRLPIVVEVADHSSLEHLVGPFLFAAFGMAGGGIPEPGHGRIQDSTNDVRAETPLPDPEVQLVPTSSGKVIAISKRFITGPILYSACINSDSIDLQVCCQLSNSHQR